MNLNEFDELHKTFKVLEDCMERLELVKKDSNFDKKGLGFNLDSRFSAFKIQLSLDSWQGKYGNSGCGTIVHVANTDIFKKYLLKNLNKNIEKTLYDMVQSMKKDLAKEKEIKIQSLQEEIAKYEKI